MTSGQLDEAPAGAAAPTGIEAISYTDLYSRWERSNWSATEIDFTRDAHDWREGLTPFQRRAALWNYALFFVGEDAVTDALGAYIDAAPREEQKYFLATQQVDEARHSVFFRRFLEEACGIGDGTAAGALAAVRAQLTWGFRKVFGRLETMQRELRRDPSTTRLCAGVALYHMVIEAMLAQPGQELLTRYMTENDLMPGFREGMENVATDEHRHVAFGVRFLRDHAAGDERAREAVAGMMREVMLWTPAVLAAPGGDRRYTEVFGFSLADIGEHGMKSLEAKMRMAGLPLEDLPGASALPLHLAPRARAMRGQALLEAGVLGEPGRAPDSDPETVEMLVDTLRSRIDTRRAPEGFTVDFAFRDADRWHVRVAGGSADAVRGAAPGRGAVTISARYADFCDVVAGRVTPVRAALGGRVRAYGPPRALRLMPALFGT